MKKEGFFFYQFPKNLVVPGKVLQSACHNLKPAPFHLKYTYGRQYLLHNFH